MKNRVLSFGLVVALVIGTMMVTSGNDSQAAEKAGATSGSALLLQDNSLPPANVKILSIKKETSLKTVTLTWGAVSGANGYYVMRKSGKGVYQTVACVTGTSYKDTSVKAGTKYTYEIRAWYKTPLGILKIGGTQGAKSINLIPGKVTGMKVKKKRGRFIVTWKKTKGATGYQVYTKVYVKGIKMKYTKAKTLKKRKYKRGMLVKGMKYGFKVRAYKKVNGKKVYGPFTMKKKRY